MNMIHKSLSDLIQDGFIMKFTERISLFVKSRVKAYPDIKSGSKLCYHGGTSTEIYQALKNLQDEVKLRKQLNHG